MWIWHPEEPKKQVEIYFISSTFNPRPLCIAPFNIYSPLNFNIHLALNVKLIGCKRDWLINGGDLKNSIKIPDQFCFMSNLNVPLRNLRITGGFTGGFCFFMLNLDFCSFSKVRGRRMAEEDGWSRCVQGFAKRAIGGGVSARLAKWTPPLQCYQQSSSRLCS